MCRMGMLQLRTCTEARDKNGKTDLGSKPYLMGVGLL